MEKQIQITNTTEADFMYDYAKRINSKWITIYEAKDITNKNKKYIFDFLQSCLIESLSNARLDFYIDKLRLIAKILKKDFDKCTRKDIEQLILTINNNYLKAESRRAYVVTIKKFYRWLTNSENPEIISWIKTKNYERNAIKQNEKNKVANVLTPDEIEKMISCAKNPRDKALVGVLYYSGCRLGELVGMRIKDIEFLEHRTIVKVCGKTGYRAIPIPECTTLLKTWLQDYHPNRNDKEAYVWINLINVNRINNLKQFNFSEKQQKIKKLEIKNQPIGVRYINSLLEKLSVQANITKKVNPHNFRHSRLTQLGLLGLNTEMLKMYAGHSKNSNTTSQYTHFSENDLANAIDKMNGLKVREEKENKMIKCSRCGHLNRNTIELCECCGLALNTEIAMRLTKQTIAQNKMGKIINSLLEDEVFRKAIAVHLVNKGMTNLVGDLAETEI